ncbi:hypothetical protein GPECTOR_1g10 [Gonium pectorale]|uniref:Uncharacterized protein n=1 Tax=Gonium pectorale TaxID=33097 RepID=A0A150H1V7_GONPE|nr:hypothetical protein GPECTOR_1g10 [Gonium pectorale]|eukprot:KXZ56119.1 hypothetical protein GPECTOR_1g10 [Gonium pectorale]
MHTKEELLAFVGQCYIILDPINLVHPPYSQEVKGIDARCVSNLIWALVKLDLALDAGCTGNEVILSILPLVMRLLGQSSPQGLANLLWAYAKLSEPPVEVIASIMSRMTEMLSRDQTGSLFDAQALSNSIWAVAHARSKVANFDVQCGPAGAVSAFLVAIAVSANSMLRALYTRLDMAHLSAFLNNVEHKFSCQALVNIVWSFATILGDECGQHPVIMQLFVASRKEAILRLRATFAALQTQQAWVYHMPGGFNEQALSNVVYAYEKAGLLDRELLHWVFSVAALRLDRRDGPPSFKPQELCTLLRAAHLEICEPQPFLAKLARIVQSMPWIVRNWSSSELNELSRALGLLQPSLIAQQHAHAQAQAQAAQQAAAAAAAQQQAQAQQAAVAAAAALPLLSLAAAANGSQLDLQFLLQANALVSAAGVGNLGVVNSGNNLVNGGGTGISLADLVTAELQQMSLQNAIAAQLNAAAAAAAGLQPYGGVNGRAGGAPGAGIGAGPGRAGGAQNGAGLPLNDTQQALQLLQSLQLGPAPRQPGLSLMPSPGGAEWR